MTLTEVLVVAGLIGGLGAQFGYLRWWQGQQEAVMKRLTDDVARHRQDATSVHEQLQALAVNEANVGGTISNLALEIKQIRRDLDDRERVNGNLLQLKLNAQTNELILKMRDMMGEFKKEMRQHP